MVPRPSPCLTKSIVAIAPLLIFFEAGEDGSDIVVQLELLKAENEKRFGRLKTKNRILLASHEPLEGKFTKVRLKVNQVKPTGLVGDIVLIKTPCTMTVGFAAMPFLFGAMIFGVVSIVAILTSVISCGSSWREQRTHRK